MWMCNVYNNNKLQIKLGWALFVTYTIIQSIMSSEMCSLHLTHPSVHTWSSGQPTVQHPGSSRGLPARAGIDTHNLGLPSGSSPTLYPLGQRLPCVVIYAYNICMCTWYIIMVYIKYSHIQYIYIEILLCVSIDKLVDGAGYGGYVLRNARLLSAIKKYRR